MQNKVNGKYFKARSTTCCSTSVLNWDYKFLEKIKTIKFAKHLLVIFLTSNFFLYAKAQVSASSKNTVQGLDEKKILAKEFFELAGMKEELLTSMQFGDGFLNRTPNEKNPDIAAQNKKVYAAAKAKWLKRKESLTEEITQQLLKDIANSFSVPELKYLIEVSKASVFKKYKFFLKSDAFGKVFNTPPLVARNFVDDARKELAAPIKVPTKQ